MTDRGDAPTEKVWAIYYLYAQQFPIAITLDQRSPDDEAPYSVTVGEGEEEFTRLSDDEVGWLIRKKVGIR
ncbi:hypothetical protein UFOVP529_90 [uncultured Caudovirales phage]|uniref:Uncharacterized protein n=1 Tax=uncultured Caudovirales phage TaxID=2100421 RepID=A0A6J5MSA7_9CAUD|nr:hypothetical protein UFOVP529_90 [uncultured Caudovirales phage]CAB4190015.1 hypothetical protein UFOVP1191_28 [uncultured Caudovirales phage]CAB4194380.1 hypothetical protein UFOVP1252_31 [uncultured Caudovirales phage]